MGGEMDPKHRPSSTICQSKTLTDCKNRFMSDAFPESEDKRILKEEVIGVLPAVALSEKGPLQCGLVFATNLIIVAFLGKYSQIAGAIRTPDYHIMKRGWARYEHKPTALILDKYKSYIIPYSDITRFGAAGTGRIFRKSRLYIHTTKHLYTFNFRTSLETLERDVSQLLQGTGANFSKEMGGLQPNSNSALSS